MLQIGESTMWWIFVAYVTFIEAMLSPTNFKLDYGYLPCSITEIFVSTGNSLIGIFIDLTTINVGTWQL